jgi:hypothetical protein
MKYTQPHDKPGDPNAPYVNGNPATGTPGSIPPAAAFEEHQRELVHLIEYSGQTPSPADLQQVRKAIQSIIGDTQAKGSLIARRVWATPGTVIYAATAGTKRIRVTVIGAGGAGGGTTAQGGSTFAAAGGGGGGGVGVSDISAAFDGAAIVVGAAGVGVAGANGGNGGTSSFGAVLSATGGQGGAVGSGSSTAHTQHGGTGGASSGGNVSNSSGGNGSPAVAFADSNFVTGAGGNTQMGAGAGGRVSNTGPGFSPVTPGGGGSGAGTRVNGAAQVGGNGAHGMVIVEEYA